MRRFACPVIRPIPKSDPTETWIVETGSPNRLASTTRTEVVLGEKDRYDRASESCDRRPAYRGAICASATAEEGSDTFKVVIRAVGVHEKAGY